MAADVVIPWRRVTLAPAVLRGEVERVLDEVDALRTKWAVSVEGMPPAEFKEARDRSLRRHAVETGLIEQIYSFDGGVTEALVVEGISAEIFEREGQPAAVFELITDQLDGLGLVVDIVKGERPVSSHAVRELHAVITRSQMSYEAHDQFGRAVTPILLHGEWKREPNHVRRPDGSLLQYTPPEQVDSEMDRLVELYQQQSDLRPIVRAAWLHYAFIIIHPFQDGNGRVARALVLLELLKHHYAPLVVDRKRRPDYLHALNEANSGDLSTLVRLFAELEKEALRSELSPTPMPLSETQPSKVARAYADRVLAQRDQAAKAKQESTVATAAAVHERIRAWLAAQQMALQPEFGRIDPASRVTLDSATPDDGDRGRYWGRQIVQAARVLNFLSNYREGTWWCRLRVDVAGEELRFLAILQRVGHGATGVLALTVLSEFVEPADPDSRPVPTPAMELRSVDSLTFTAGEDVNRRAGDLEEVLERTLAVSLDALGTRLT